MRYLFCVLLDFLIRNWALVIASVLVTAISLFVLYRAFSDSAQGQLMRHVRTLDERYRHAERAQQAVNRAASKLEKLRAKAVSVKPRHGQEAAEALEDARSLLKIAEDQVLIAENHVRKIIVEEYPPKRQEALRGRYLKRPEDTGKPFTF